jgi:PHD/YefM family antitoxin component YafN of YafNO toxin-antitoxin module
MLRSPSYIVGPDGEPTAVLVDLVTWRAIIDRLEDQEDLELLRASAEDLETLARGDRPSGWKTWEEFEAELDALEQAGELSS